MKRLLIFRIIFVAMISGMLFLVPCQVISKEDPVLKEIEALIERVDSLIEAGGVDQAITIGEQVLEKAKKAYGEADPAVARALDALGNCYYEQANYEKCKPLWLKALEIREQAS